MNFASKFVAIEGLDGSGKSTQIDLLKSYMESQNVPVRFIHFPRHHEGIFGELISKFLRGEFGSVETVHPQLVALLFAEDRNEFAETMYDWLEEGYFVLVDRYVLSNIAFQCGKLMDENEKLELRTWILDFEYEYNKIPKPDLSIYLNAPETFVRRSLTTRLEDESRDYLKGKQDIHEQNFTLQSAVMREYGNLFSTQENIVSISCCGESGEMRTKEEIHLEIVNALEVHFSKQNSE